MEELFQLTPYTLALGGPQGLYQPEDLACTVVQLVLEVWHIRMCALLLDASSWPYNCNAGQHGRKQFERI